MDLFLFYITEEESLIFKDQPISILVATKVTKEVCTWLILFRPFSMTSQDFIKVSLNFIVTVENYGHFGGAVYVKNAGTL